MKVAGVSNKIEVIFGPDVDAVLVVLANLVHHDVSHMAHECNLKGDAYKNMIENIKKKCYCFKINKQEKGNCISS